MLFSAEYLSGFEKCMYFAFNASRKEVPPANNVIPITIKISVIEIRLGIVFSVIQNDTIL